MRGIGQFRGVAFDMDGLLLDSERLAKEAFLETCQQFELGDRSDVFQGCIGVKWENGLKILEDSLGKLVDVDHFAQTWNEKYHAVSRGVPIPLKSGVKEILRCIQELDIPMVVATSTHTASAEPKLELTGLRPFFQKVIGGDQVQKGKPHPEIYLRAAEILDVEPRFCLAFEDSENGTRAALASGMTVVQIPDLVEPSAQLKQLGPIVLGSLLEAIEYPFAKIKGAP